MRSPASSLSDPLPGFGLPRTGTAPDLTRFLEASNELLGALEGAVSKDKWAKGVFSPKSRDNLGKILKRGYINVQYPTLDPIEGAQLERSLRISFTLLVSATPLVTGSPNSSKRGGVTLPSSTSHVPSPPHFPSNTAQVTTGSTQPNAILIPSPILANSPAKIPSPLPTPAGLLIATPARPSTLVPSNEQPGITEKENAHVSYPATDVPLGSRLGGANHDEVVSRFKASCPGGSLMSMAKLHTEILAAKGASVLAEGCKIALATEKQLLTLKEAYIVLQARLKDTHEELAQSQQSMTPLLQAAKESEEGRQAVMVEA
ncbi:hypothetical protein QYF36_009682 [Acer negundo]|nr:hypothetical protein QYF36_009682 [Acer negundo]